MLMAATSVGGESHKSRADNVRRLRLWRHLAAEGFSAASRSHDGRGGSVVEYDLLVVHGTGEGDRRVARVRVD